MLRQKDLKPRDFDKDLDKLGFVSDAAEAMGRRLTGPGIAVILLVLSAAVAASYVFSSGVSHALILVAATGIAAYMALNIGANDVANNVGPAVGARVISVSGALLIAAICESAGAFLAGGKVISTVSGDILSPSDTVDNFAFMRAMLTAMAAAALWINLSTIIGAPVSTTHSIVGGIVGAGVAVGGFSAVGWPTVATIAGSWVVAPVLGGGLAASLMAFFNFRVIYAEDRLESVRRWLPVLLGLTGAIFTAYVLFKIDGRFVHIRDWLVVGLSVAVGLGVWRFYRVLVTAQLRDLDDDARSMRKLFTVPLMITAALLSFAHGANDVANAIGPLAAIVRSQSYDIIDLNLLMVGDLDLETPLWVTGVGAFGISAGLLLFGRRLVTVVGKQITRLNPVRAFCVTLATAATVLAASGLGLPVSTTHIAVGSVFGVGFFREWYRNRYVAEGGRMKPRKMLRNREERRRRLLVRRANLLTIIGAWAITLPAAAVLAAALYTLVDLAIS